MRTRVCVYACVYMCVCVCGLSVYLQACEYVCIYACMRVVICVCMCACMCAVHLHAELTNCEMYPRLSMIVHHLVLSLWPSKRRKDPIYYIMIPASAM